MPHVGCGKASLLVRTAERYGASGIGVDIDGAFLAEGRANATRRGVASRVELLQMEASRSAAHPASFDAGICVGSTRARGSDRDWDRYEGLYARTVETYVATHPDDPDATAMRERIRRWRETCLRWARNTLGFGLYLFGRP